MKTRVVCRFCGKTHAKRAEGDCYKPVLYGHKCPHGKECLGGRRKGKGQNWSVLVLGGKDVDGCRQCYEWQLTAIVKIMGGERE
jgi:hypothetical protein